MPQTCRMILDVDTGIDDAMAILYALARPGISLEALTTTFGNTDVDTATANTLRILELAGRADIEPKFSQPVMGAISLRDSPSSLAIDQSIAVTTLVSDRS